LSAPEKIIVGPMVYDVLNDTQSYAQAVVDHNEQVYGRVNYGEARIILDPKQHEQHKRKALLHEVLHACWHVTDPLDPHECEEMAVRTLTGPLLDVLRRNPAFVAYLLADD
jgi:hypothetical protein